MVFCLVSGSIGVDSFVDYPGKKNLIDEGDLGIGSCKTPFCLRCWTVSLLLEGYHM
jgi:hypothetical protein